MTDWKCVKVDKTTLGRSCEISVDFYGVEFHVFENEVMALRYVR